MIGTSKISRLLFADDLVLQAFYKSGFQQALNGFAAAAACGNAGIKISISKAEVLFRSKNPFQSMFSASCRCVIKAGGEVQASWGCIHE